MTDLSLHGLAHALRDERWSAITHGAGAVLGVAGGAVLITLAALWGDGWQLASAIVFSVTLVLLYTASAFYHAAPFKTALKARLKVLDHCAIYLLIAGTYTPISLVGLREHGDGGCSVPSGPWRWAASCSSCSPGAASSCCPR